MRVLLRKSDNRILQSQSGGDKSHLGVLVQFAESRGYAKSEVEAKIIDETEFAALLAVQNEADKTYAEKRSAEYPPVGDQLAALWEAVNALTSGKDIPQSARDTQASIAAVKAKYPKV